MWTFDHSLRIHGREFCFKWRRRKLGIEKEKPCPKSREGSYSAAVAFIITNPEQTWSSSASPSQLHLNYNSVPPTTLYPMDWYLPSPVTPRFCAIKKVPLPPENSKEVLAVIRRFGGAVALHLICKATAEHTSHRILPTLLVFGQ